MLRTLSTVLNWKITISFCIIDQSFASINAVSQFVVLKLGKISPSKFVGFLYQLSLVVSFDSVNEILKYDYSNESYSAVIFCGTFYKMKLGFWASELKVSKCLRKPMCWFCSGIFVWTQTHVFCLFYFQKWHGHENKDRTGGAKGSEKRKKDWTKANWKR